MKNILFFLAYFLGAIVGGLAAVSPNGASPVWPAAGIALAAVHLYGIAVLPGILFGSLLAQIHSFQDFSNTEKVFDSLWIGLVIALGSSLQAVFGGWLLKKNRVFPSDPLLNDGQILRFIFFGAFVSTTIAPTVGAITLLLKGVIAPASFLLTWGTWWIGDSVGILAFTPIVLIFSAQPRYFWRERITTVALPLMALMVLVMILFMYSRQQFKFKVREKFDFEVTRLHTQITAELQHSVLDNRILKAFFDNSGQVNRQNFEAFTLPLLRRTPYMQALEWIPRITERQRARFEQSERQPFQILDPDADRSLRRASRRTEYFPILWTQPLQNNQSVIGYDIANNIGAARLLHEIQINKQTLVSTPIRLQQDTDRANPEWAYVIYSPVFNTTAERNMKGIVASVFRVRELIDHVLAANRNASNYLSVSDGDMPIYSNYPVPLPHGTANYDLSRTLPLQVANKFLSVSYLPSIGFITAQQTWTVWFILLGGFVFTGLSGIGLLMLTGRTLKTEELIRHRTSELDTAKKTLEQQNKVLIDALFEAEQGVRTKDSFLASMSHELRT
ncbi:MAG: CHASE domain-containing protein, partial [Gammaproteobacteria bacterium]